MVSTGGSAGGSGFEYGENTVAARLSIDIPTEGVQSLREITQEISRFRTEMEAAARSEGDFIGFFQTLPSIASQAANAYRSFADQLERSLAMQQRVQGAVGQWDVQPGSTPDNFKGMSAGMGRSPNDISQTVADMDRMREMGTVGERQYLNVHQQRGAMRSGDMPTSNSDNDIAAATDRISARERINQERMGGTDPGAGGAGRINMGYGGGGIAREIMNEFSVGSGTQGGYLTQTLRRGIGAIADRMGSAAPGSTGTGGAGHASGAVPAPASGTSGAADGSPGGGGIGGLLSMLGRGMGTAGDMLGIGGLSALGGPLAIAGMGLTGFQLAQSMGPRLQNLKDQGLVTGGGAKEGLEQEVNARIMAMSPFLSNDQSRSIIQSALRDGYSGKEYETVTKFMADNIKDFAISVNDSRDIIKKQMVEGGLSSGAISAGLEQQKQLSKEGYLKFPDRQKALTGLMNQMADMGVSPENSAKAAAEGIEMFSDSELHKGRVADMMSAGMSGDLNTQAAMLSYAGITPDSDFANWSDQLAAGGGAAMQNILRKAAMNTPSAGAFYMLLTQQFGQNMTMAQAKDLWRRLRNGENEYSAASGRLANNPSNQVNERSAASMAIAGVGSATSILGGTISDLLSGNPENIPQRARNADFTNQSEHIPILDKLVESQGGDPNNILVQSDSGEWQKLQPKNEEQLKALSVGGKWKFASDQSSQGYTLAQAPGVMNSNFGKQNVEVQGQVQIHVSADPGVKVNGPQSRTITLTQNQIAANAGWGNATINNPPPGDR